MAKSKHNFKPVDPKKTFPDREQELLDYWKENKIFEESIQSRPSDKIWNFLDGPPFVTGMPHYGTLLSSIPKDVFGRYWTMKGYRVPRVWGWDGHGLPIENKVENKLKIERKRDIEEKVGVKKFIEECKKYVSEVSGEWEWYVDKIARWVDFENAYKTWNKDYMESVMWVFKQMYASGHIYKGLRVSLYCPHCVTPVSNFEVAMDPENYKSVTEPANTYKYQLEGEKNTYFLAWSTTPWNKIITPALAVNPKLTYVKVKQGEENYILAKSTLNILSKIPKHKIIAEYKGSELVGKKFVGHYDFYVPKRTDKKVFEIIGGDFVTADEGTGIVTIAAYGEDDLKVMKENNILIYLHVDEEGHLKREVPNWAGLYYLKVNKLVNEDLEKRGLIYKEEEITHKIPICWRCHTRLMHSPQNAWFVNIQDLKDKLIKNNEEVNWVPKHFKHGRFLKSMQAAPDWCISRNRYWGSPVPVWECDCGERIVPGSIKELEELSGQAIPDLHKPDIDEITIECANCGKNAKRVPEVLDSWIEAGSASFAERHFPFKDDAKLENFFPPDFITEYTGQIRAWFYVLHVIGTAIYDQNAFKNVLVSGVILGTDGRKMSKNFGNYPDPKKLLTTLGGDALRLYLLGSPVMLGQDIVISEEEYRNQLKNFLIPLKNIHNFFTTYAIADNWTPEDLDLKSTNPIDNWILSRLQGLVENATEKGYEKYKTPYTIKTLQEFLINDLSLWYVRRSRNRVGPSAPDPKDKTFAHSTLWYVLTEFSKLLAPIAPYMAEDIYLNLTGNKSVHLEDFPKTNKKHINGNLEEEMKTARNLVELAHAQRKEKQLKVRQPLASLTTTAPVQLSEEVKKIIADEINVLEVKHAKSEELTAELDTNITKKLKQMGETREIIRSIQAERKKLGTQIAEKIIVKLPSWPKEHEEEIKAKALVTELKKGDFKIIRN